MKTCWSVLLGLNLLFTATAAESTNAPSASTPAPTSAPVAVAPPSSLVAPPLTPKEVEASAPDAGAPSLGGAGPAIFRAKKPLQMLNPAAPKEYGDGTQFLSLNPHTGNSEGVTLLSFRLFSKSPGTAKAPKSPKAKKSKAIK
jgi:hypothetical protein